METPVKSNPATKAGASRLSQLMHGVGDISACTTRREALERAAALAVEVFQAESAVITLLGDGGERFESYSSAAGAPGTPPDSAPFLGVPLAYRGVVRGSLYLTGMPQSTFTDDDEHLAVILTGCAATVLDRLDWESERDRLRTSHARLLSTLSHDLGNALTAIYGWGDMLVRRRDPLTVPRAAYELLSAAEDAIGVLHDTVDLTRLEFHELVPSTAPVDGAEIFENVASRADATARTHDIELRRDGPEGSPRVMTDRRRLEQLLVHLLLDVIEHAERGTTVRFAAQVQRDEMIFVIERLEAGPSSDAAPRNDEESGLDPDRGLALWQRIGALIGAGITVPHGPRSRPGFRVAVAAEPIVKASS